MMISSATLAASLTLADSFNGHHGWGDWGDGWWIVMAALMVAFWAAVIGAGIWFARELISRRQPDASADDESPALAVLDRRLAEGTISIDEYKERRRVLIHPGSRGDSDGG